MSVDSSYQTSIVRCASTALTKPSVKHSQVHLHSQVWDVIHDRDCHDSLGRPRLLKEMLFTTCRGGKKF
jgi:hypothetical protein